MKTVLINKLAELEETWQVQASAGRAYAQPVLDMLERITGLLAVPVTDPKSIYLNELIHWVQYCITFDHALPKVEWYSAQRQLVWLSWTGERELRCVIDCTTGAIDYFVADKRWDQKQIESSLRFYKQTYSSQIKATVARILECYEWLKTTYRLCPVPVPPADQYDDILAQIDKLRTAVVTLKETSRDK